MSEKTKSNVISVEFPNAQADQMDKRRKEVALGLEARLMEVVYATLPTKAGHDYQDLQTLVFVTAEAILEWVEDGLLADCERALAEDIIQSLERQREAEREAAMEREREAERADDAETE